MNNEPLVVAQVMGKWVGGGVEAMIMNYYRNIDHSKVQFHFIFDEDSNDIPYEEIEKLGGKVILIPPYQKIFKYHKELKRVLKEGNYKIVHSHVNVLSVFSLFAAKCAGVPVRIAHSHSTSNKKEWKKNLVKNILRPFSKLFATDYFACSELAGRYQFGNKAFDKGKVTIINNAIDLDKFKYDEKIRKEKRKELGISDDIFVMGHVGRFVTVKNHKFIVDRFNELHRIHRNSKLLLLGQGPLESEIKEYVSKLGLKNDVIFIGQVYNVYEYYNVMDMMILPSLYEGFGMVVLESQINKLISICSSNVPLNVKCTNLVEFIELNDIKKWIEVIKSKMIIGRNDNCNFIDIDKYNIKNEANKLENKYINLSKIKVCHVVSGLISGGVESMIYNYCSRLDKHKYEFHLLYQHEANKKNIKELESIGFKLCRIPSKTKNPIMNFIKTYSYLKTNKIDIVHSHMTLLNFIPLFAAMLLHIKVRISHSHTNKIEKCNIFKRMFNMLCRNLTIAFSNVYLACGKNAGNYLYKDKVKFKIINNSLDINKYLFSADKRESIRKKYNIHSDELLIGHVARFVNVKNHSFVINLLSHCKNKKIKVMFVGDGELKNKIIEMVNDFNLSEQVIFAGVVDNVDDYYSAFDIIILPSLFEGIPLSIIEAQANGLKCIISDGIDKNVIIDKSKVLQLKLSNDLWSTKLLSEDKEYDRNINVDCFNKKHMNIEKEYLLLDSLYSDNMEVKK